MNEDNIPEFPLQTEIAIIGAGAAGLMAAITAARLGARVHVFDGAKKVGAKIIVSGGSRCNVTNVAVAPARFHGEGAPAFVSRILRAYSPDLTRKFFEEIGVPLKLEETGKYFPVSDSSRQVLGALLHTMHRAGAVLCSETDVSALEPDPETDGWKLETSRGPVFARTVILATGGLALPKSGSNGRGHNFARALGHTIISTTPALTPLLTNDVHYPLVSGITMPVRLRLHAGNDARSSKKIVTYEGSFLFTHRGFSGPVALNISRHFAHHRPTSANATIFLSLLPDVADGEEARWWHEFVGKSAKKTVFNALGTLFSTKLTNVIMARAGLIGSLPLGRLSKTQNEALKRELFYAPMDVFDVAPYDKAETTAGGIALAEIEPATMQSRLHKGLFFAGEVCDVDGELGGFNFQWAWSSGVVAGRAATHLSR
ncbi:aminoacetone oxidase family FAD-binding enzyme [bacterium]|nr:MAG: aminoacetone oxidase family FAD-binding enzyme [bacterium]